MTTQTWRGWRFVQPETEIPEEGTGVLVGASGGIETVEGHAAVRQSLLMLLSTTPGERVMRPDYGCDLRRLVFSPNDDTTAGLAIHYVRQAVARFEPRVKVLRVDATRDEADPGRLQLYLEYCLRATLERSALGFSLELSGDSP